MKHLVDVSSPEQLRVKEMFINNSIRKAKGTETPPPVFTVMYPMIFHTNVP